MFLKRIFSFIPRNDFSKALDLFNNGNYRKALKKFEELMDRDEAVADSATIELYTCEAHVALSKEHIRRGEIEQAREELQRAVALKPTFADLRHDLGQLYFQTGDHQKACSNFRAALEINPRFFKARISLAQAFAASGKWEEAIAEVRAAQQSCPAFYRDKLSELERALRVGDAPDGLFTAIMEEKPGSAELSRQLAVEAIQNANYTEAIRELKKALALKPDYPDLHNFLGIAYGNNGMVDDAIEEFERALKINPYYSKARLNLALALYENGRFSEARAHIDQVLSVQPENQLAKNLLTEIETVGER